MGWQPLVLQLCRHHFTCGHQNGGASHAAALLWSKTSVFLKDQVPLVLRRGSGCPTPSCAGGAGAQGLLCRVEPGLLSVLVVQESLGKTWGEQRVLP